MRKILGLLAGATFLGAAGIAAAEEEAEGVIEGIEQFHSGRQICGNAQNGQEDVGKPDQADQLDRPAYDFLRTVGTLTLKELHSANS